MSVVDYYTAATRVLVQRACWDWRRARVLLSLLVAILREKIARCEPQPTGIVTGPGIVAPFWNLEPDAPVHGVHQDVNGRIVVVDIAVRLQRKLNAGPTADIKFSNLALPLPGSSVI